jgi:hypothetical protein
MDGYTSGLEKGSKCEKRSDPLVQGGRLVGVENQPYPLLDFRKPTSAQRYSTAWSNIRNPRMQAGFRGEMTAERRLGAALGQRQTEFLGL